VRIGAGLSTLPDIADAVRQAAAPIDGAVDLAFLFLSPHHRDAVGEAVMAASAELHPAHLVGCVAEGVLGAGREVEDGPAAVLWGASLPGAEVEPFHAAAVDSGDATVVTGFPDVAEASLVALLVDPFTFPAGPFLTRLNAQRPRLPVVGGLAVGGQAPGEAALVLDDDVHQEGAVGVRIAGVPVRTVVSQGCAPFGREAVVTRAEGNVVFELAGEPALARLRSEISRLSDEERALVSGGILVGLVIDENRAEYGRGDYLMRGIIGADEESGALAVGEHVRVGQTVRFHVRDARSADDDLRASLADSLDGVRPAGALLFTCNGRGTRMFPQPHHDVEVVGDAMGNGSVAGFFCGGEIGPVGGQTFVHGFTATLAVFLEADETSRTASRYPG
jgi:small ligand-binding sensory domain FIST